MSVIANILWIILGGLPLAIVWTIVGLLWCVTIVGIPVGVQCLKIARLALAPFGAEVQYGGGAPSLILNILWLIFGGLELALIGVISGAILCITIIGIPAGLQAFKFAQLALMPFGAKVA
ncbi:MAG: YccF domain-containing protein [Coriobacteriia bacterium]|nr:YccF domain-containing protein [Coriobacteriia bacterium]MBS5477393.1 YccF domain-containing protein [Coriobacteriia bacterium]